MALVVATLVGSVIAPGPAMASSIQVTTVQDPAGSSGDCSLRHAITAAQTDNAFKGCPGGSGEDTILLPQGTYKTGPASGEDDDVNVKGDFDILGTDPLTIRPDTAKTQVIVSGVGRNRVFHHEGSGNLTLLGLTVTNGVEKGTEDVAGYGGGIASFGPTTLQRVSVINNVAAAGGGISSVGELSISNSTIAANTATAGGGIEIFGPEPVTVVSSTIVRNTSAGRGAGVESVLANPHESISATVTFSNVLLAENSAREAECYIAELFYPDFFLTTQPTGPNAQCASYEGEPEDGIIRVADAGLGEIDDSGPTPTISLEPGSPAIRAGGTGEFACPAIDQAGKPRPNGKCDIGAVQYDGPYPFKSLKLTGPKRTLTLSTKRPMRTARLKVKFQGAGLAAGSSLCLRPGKWQRSMRRFGKRCRKLGTLESGPARLVSFKLKKKFGGKPGVRVIPAVLKAPRFVKREVKVRIRVR